MSMFGRFPPVRFPARKPAGRLSGYRVGSGDSERQGLVENCRFAFGFAGSARGLNIDAPYAALRVEWIAGEPLAS